ncbi:MAG: VanZ family protein [Lachnospiraceae bacterium]|nr:VanZ family protein [Lachnospiraceae bacterium]
MAEKRREGLKQVLGAILFVVYLIVLVYLLFFAESYGRTSVTEMRYNFIPFHEIKRYLTNIDRIGPWLVFINVFGNILIFLPFGYLVSFFWRKKRFIAMKVFFLSMIFSCAIELAQLLTRVGSCDVDDVILNTTGGLIGSLLYLLFRHCRRKK